MRLGILGSGDVGKALARGFVSRNHEVAIGSRTPGKLSDFAGEQQGRLRAATFAEAAAFGKLVVLAVEFAHAMDAIDLAGDSNLEGKTVMDVTNPLKFEEGKLPSLSIGLNDSAGETLQRRLPRAKVVKAFNIIGNADMVDPRFEGGPPTMFICGNDEGAKKTVAAIVESFGWKNEVIDVGGIEESRYLEPLCMLWVHYAIRFSSRHHGFKLLRGDELTMTSSRGAGRYFSD